MSTVYDHIVVGSGAGGGTVAARLAEAGQRVLVLEAGGDPRTLSGGVAGLPQANRLPDDYDVPAFHAFASENNAMSWDFHVKHYADAATQTRDDKASERGVFYPRAGTLGGCTAHNAMIFMAPPDLDWQQIAEMTGDDRWSPEVMHGYFQKLEACCYRPVQKWLSKLGIDRTGHGYGGWLSTEKALPIQAFTDDAIRRTIVFAAREMLSDSPSVLERLEDKLKSAGDPNDRDAQSREGLYYTPLSTQNGTRVGTRERLLDVARRFPDRLTIETEALATRILFDDDNRACAVVYQKGSQLYRAHSVPAQSDGTEHIVSPRKEIILAGGAFNTPQLLMLSGIGDRSHLEDHGLKCRVDLPGVGRNLQDRYEVAVVNRMSFRHWECMDGAEFRRDDRLYKKWRKKKRGLYATNGAAVGVVRKSAPDLSVPDLFCMGLLAYFKGYYPGYAADLSTRHNYLSWAVLKARTRNRAGRVMLASSDPRDPPHVDFAYFEEGGEEDLRAVVEGVKFVRRLSEPLLLEGRMEAEEIPGPDVKTDDEIAQFVRDNAWGHHASCSCAIGALAQGGVLDSQLRVHGTKNLRVVDASVFPRIPGFFIAAAVYMIGEKAADMILHAQDTPPKHAASDFKQTNYTEKTS